MRIINKKVIFVENKCITVADIGYTKYGSHIGIDNNGNVYSFCWVNDKGSKYNAKKDGKIEFWSVGELKLML